MTKNEWEDLEPGTEIIYSLKGSDYEGTICRVLDNDDGELTIALIQPGKYGYSTWGNDETTIDGWTSEYAYKFNFLETQTLEERIVSKIKSLDSLWEKQQLQKGKNYALLRV